MFGCIEAGGTKFVCSVGKSLTDRVTQTIPTTTPEATVNAVTDFIRREAGTALASVGIGSFGPVDLNPESHKFGYITATPKPGWQDFDLAGEIARRLRVPVKLDTDVNASALGEERWGAAQGLSDFLYLTVGTGIGGGAMVNKRLVHGLVHPEMGHIRIPHDRAEDPYKGACPFHGDCLEGLASGTAMRERWATPADELPQDHPAWQLEARYLGLALANWVCTLSPQRIIMGGGVMQQKHMFPLVRQELQGFLNGYIRSESLLTAIDAYVVPPGLGSDSGVLGAMVLAEQAATEAHAGAGR